MIKKVIKKVTPIKRKLNITNLKSLIKKSKNLTFNDDKIYSLYGLETLNFYMPDGEVLNANKINERYFFHMTDGYLYECSHENCERILSIGYKKPLFFEINISGKKEILVLTEKGGFILSKKQIFQFIEVVDGCFCQGRGIFANEKEVFYTEPYNLDIDTNSLTLCGKVWLDDEKERVIGVYSLDKSVYVFSKSNLYKLTFDTQGGNISLKKLSDDNFDIADLSFAKSDEECAFISNGQLYKFSNGKIEKVNAIDFSKYYFLSQAKIVDSKYYVNILDNNVDSLIYIYDFIKKEQTLLSMPNEIVNSGEIVAKDRTAKQITLNKNVNGNRELTLLPIDFNDCKRKTLTGVNAYLEDECILEITGDFGKKRYSLLGGFNSILTNLNSRAFMLKFYTDKNFSIEKLSLEYIYKGE